MGYFSREILIVQVVLASNWFAVARVVCEPLWAKKSRIWFWEENATTLSEFIEYIDLIDFRQISPKHSRINDNERVPGNFDIWNICPAASIYATCLAYF